MQDMRRVFVSQDGMSLAEVLIACVIIAIGLVGLLSAVPTASYGIQEGRQLSTAAFLANQRLEQVRNAQWVQCPAPGAPADTMGVSASGSAPPASGGTTTFPDESPIAAPYADYTRTVRIIGAQPADACGGANLGLRQVTVTVTYRASTATGLGATKSAIVTMLMAQR
jgi:prepilin-type N-terminal cleavage/methylation domain-containing protein